MRGGKEHARTTQPAVPVEGPRASGSGSAPTGSSSEPSSTRDIATQPSITQSAAQSSSTQSTDQDVQSNLSAGTSSESNTGFYQDVLVECNTIVEGYQKGEIPKACAYVEIQSRLVGVLGDIEQGLMQRLDRSS